MTTLQRVASEESPFQLTDEQRALRERARRFAVELVGPRADEIDRTDQYPIDLARALAAEGFMGMILPEAYGGREATLFDVLLVVEEISKVSAIVGRIVVDANTAVPGAILHYGAEAQKRRYFPWILEGDKPAIAITEPEAGSAASELQTSARLDGDGYLLNGTKRWISGGGVSRLYLVFARFDNRPGPDGVGGLLVESTNPGLSIARVRKIMGVRGMPEADVVLADCRVPCENLLVSAGGGFQKLMKAYNMQRLGAATVALGVAQGAFDLSLAFAQERKQFGRPIAEFQGLQWMLADMHVQLEAARLLIYRAAANAGRGFPDTREAAVAKLLTAESAITVTNTAMQIHGALGYSCDLPIERMVRDARMYAIGGGTTQILRNVIASRLLPREYSRGTGRYTGAERRPQ